MNIYNSNALQVCGYMGNIFIKMETEMWLRKSSEQMSISMSELIDKCVEAYQDKVMTELNGLDLIEAQYAEPSIKEQLIQAFNHPERLTREQWEARENTRIKYAREKGYPIPERRPYPWG